MREATWGAVGLVTANAREGTVEGIGIMWTGNSYLGTEDFLKRKLSLPAMLFYCK